NNSGEIPYDLINLTIPDKLHVYVVQTSGDEAVIRLCLQLFYDSLSKRQITRISSNLVQLYDGIENDSGRQSPPCSVLDNVARTVAEHPDKQFADRFRCLEVSLIGIVSVYL